MFKIKTFEDFLILLAWVFLANLVINFIIDALNNLWTTGPNIRLYYTQPYAQLTQAASSTTSTTGASGGS